jgi:hypothetical protein
MSNQTNHLLFNTSAEGEFWLWFSVQALIYVT